MDKIVPRLRRNYFVRVTPIRRPDTEPIRSSRTASSRAIPESRISKINAKKNTTRIAQTSYRMATPPIGLVDFAPEVVRGFKAVHRLQFLY